MSEPSGGHCAARTPWPRVGPTNNVSSTDTTNPTCSTARVKLDSVCAGERGHAGIISTPCRFALLTRIAIELGRRRAENARDLGGNDAVLRASVQWPGSTHLRR